MRRGDRVRLTKRGKAVLVIALGIVIYLVATRLWWVGDGFCFDVMEKCLPMEGEGK
jgi:hypothetical protein